MTIPIDSAAVNHPSALAFDDGALRITYADLIDLVSRSRVSRLSDLRAGDHVAWCPRNDVDALVTFWSLLRRGCVVCPTSHRFPESTRREMFGRIDAKWLLDLTAELPISESASSRSAELPSTIIFSSGTTGIPKAVVHSLEAHIASALGAGINMPLGSGDRWLWSLPLSHVSGLSILVRCALAGATVVGMPEGMRLDADLLDRQGVTHLSLVTTQLRRLMAEDEFPSKHLKAVLLGGSSVDESLVRAARKRGVPVSTTYGLTETASQVTASRPRDDPSCSGTVLAGRQLKIGSGGEIFVQGKTLCLGYYEGGTIMPVVDSAGWFATGDLGRWDDQQRLIVSGRIDNMFISGGENIYPESIERAMLSLFEVDQIVVVPQADDTFGFRPVAFVSGELPSGWETVLREKIRGYEVPIKIFAWPAEADNLIKPNRKLLLELAGKM